MVRFTLKQCAYFIAVAEQGGIAQASRALNISQPAVAQAIDKLEHQFNFRLFERHHARGTELTIQGRAFIDSARSLLQQADLTENDAQAIAANMSGIIRMGCFHTIAPYYMPQIISNYKKVSPNIEVTLSELRQSEIIQAIDSGEIDLALTYDMSLQHCPVERIVLTELKPYLLLSEHHPRASQTSIKLSDMAEEPFVMFEGYSSSEYFQNILTSQGISPQIAYWSKSMESVRSAVSHGLGFSLGVMKLEQKTNYEGRRIVSIPIEEDIQLSPIVLIRKQDTHLSTQIEKLSLFCEEYFKKLPS